MKAKTLHWFKFKQKYILSFMNALQQKIQQHAYAYDITNYFDLNDILKFINRNTLKFKLTQDNLKHIEMQNYLLQMYKAYDKLFNLAMQNNINVHALQLPCSIYFQLSKLSTSPLVVKTMKIGELQNMKQFFDKLIQEGSKQIYLYTLFYLPTFEQDQNGELVVVPDKPLQLYIRGFWNTNSQFMYQGAGQRKYNGLFGTKQFENKILQSNNKHTQILNKIYEQQNIVKQMLFNTPIAESYKTSMTIKLFESLGTGQWENLIHQNKLNIKRLDWFLKHLQKQWYEYNVNDRQQQIDQIIKECKQQIKQNIHHQLKLK